MKEIRLLLIDDHQIVREGLQYMLEREDDIEVAGKAANAKDALTLVEQLSPGVILMDIKMPEIDGVELVRQLKRKQPTCNVIILTLHDEYLEQALQVGANGYLLKDIKSQELTQSIRRVYHGEVVIDERLTSASQAGRGEPKYSSPESDSSAAMITEVELIIPPPFNAVQLLRFVKQVGEEFKAIIVQQIGSWDGGVAITILLRNTTLLETMIDKLGKMPDVEEVKETPVVKHKRLPVPKKIIAGLETHSKKKILVTLKYTDTAKQLELAGTTSQN